MLIDYLYTSVYLVVFESLLSLLQLSLSQSVGVQLSCLSNGTHIKQEETPSLSVLWPGKRRQERYIQAASAHTIAAYLYGFDTVYRWQPVAREIRHRFAACRGKNRTPSGFFYQTQLLLN